MRDIDEKETIIAEFIRYEVLPYDIIPLIYVMGNSSFYNQNSEDEPYYKVYGIHLEETTNILSWRKKKDNQIIELYLDKALQKIENFESEPYVHLLSMEWFTFLEDFLNGSFEAYDILSLPIIMNETIGLEVTSDLYREIHQGILSSLYSLYSHTRESKLENELDYLFYRMNQVIDLLENENFDWDPENFKYMFSTDYYEKDIQGKIEIIDELYFNKLHHSTKDTRLKKFPNLGKITFIDRKVVKHRLLYT